MNGLWQKCKLLVRRDGFKETCFFVFGAVMLSMVFIIVVFAIHARPKTSEELSTQQKFVVEDRTYEVACQCGRYIDDGLVENIARVSNKRRRTTSRRRNIANQIVGGEEVQPNSIPWQVGIKYKGVFPFCGGTIVGPLTILTAAHCFDSSRTASDFSVLVGEHDIHVHNETVSFEIPVHEIIIHPKYSTSPIVYDYAVMRMRYPIPFSGLANAACLPTSKYSNSIDNRNLVASGWGDVEDSETGHTKSGRKLKKAVLKAFTDYDCCTQRYSNTDCTLSRTLIDESVICAGSQLSQLGICFGDSGGPLTYYNGSHTLLMGISSYVIAGCGTTGVVDGFAKVAHQLNWIRDSGDHYVQQCSAQMPANLQCFNNTDCHSEDPNKVCRNRRCECRAGFLLQSNGLCLDECEAMTTINECNTAVLNPTGNDWSHSIVIESGEAASEEWCFCSLEPFSGQRRFQVTYNFFRADRFGDSFDWFRGPYKMPSRLVASDDGHIYDKKIFDVTSRAMIARWRSSAVEVIFEKINITIKAF